MNGAKVLKISVPTYIGIDEYEARLTLKQAAELCVEDFMKELSRREVSVINWDEEELKIAEELARERKG